MLLYTDSTFQDRETSHLFAKILKMGRLICSFPS